jgi:hypothetical protein
LIKRHLTLLIAALALGLFSAPVFAADLPTETAAPSQPFTHPSDDVSYTQNLQEDATLIRTQPSNNGEVQYVSGGVGEDDMNALDAEKDAYNLKLLFVAGGAYLANVGVHITDSNGHEILDTKTEGPVLLVKIPRGSYTVTAAAENGATITQRITVGSNPLSSYVLHYAALEKQMKRP